MESFLSPLYQAVPMTDLARRWEKLPPNGFPAALCADGGLPSAERVHRVERTMPSFVADASQRDDITRVALTVR